jgi:hypothetical protein
MPKREKLKILILIYLFTCYDKQLFKIITISTRVNWITNQRPTKVQYLYFKTILWLYKYLLKILDFIIAYLVRSKM